MLTKIASFFMMIVFLIGISMQKAVADDWAFELSADAKKIYTKKIAQIPCDQIDQLLQKNDVNSLYIAIRDAALFDMKKCDKYIKKNYAALVKFDGVKDSIAFYNYKNGAATELKTLSKSFDKNAKRIGDHWTIDLFGYINEWNISGRRLLRHAKYADGVGAEALCSAIMWRRYLYGENSFKYNWFKIGKEEKVRSEILRRFFEDCHP